LNFTIAKPALVAALTHAASVADRRTTTIPILSHVCLMAGSGLTVAATDLELSFVAEIEADVTDPGGITLPAKRLLDYVRLLPDAPITIKASGKDWVSITCGRSRTRIAGISVGSFPEIPTAPASMWSVSTQDIGRLIKLVVFAISREESRFTLNGALLTLTADTATLVASDGHRLALATVPTKFAGKPVSFLVPQRVLSEIPSVLGGHIQVAWDDTNLFFWTPGRALVMRGLSGKFPDYERVLPKEHAHMARINRKDLLTAIGRVAQFANDRSRGIIVEAAAGEIRLRAELADTGETSEAIGAECSATMTTSYNADYLREFLSATEAETVEYRFSGPDKPGEFGLPDDASCRYVVMPMRS